MYAVLLGLPPTKTCAICGSTNLLRSNKCTTCGNVMIKKIASWQPRQLQANSFSDAWNRLRKKVAKYLHIYFLGLKIIGV